MPRPLEAYDRFVALTDFTAETLQKNKNKQNHSINNGKQYLYISKKNQIGLTPHSFEKMSIDKLRNVFIDRINAVVKEERVNQDLYNQEILQKFSTKINSAIGSIKALSTARIKKREQDYAKRSVFTKLFYYAYYAYYNRQEKNAIKLFEKQCNTVIQKPIERELKHGIFHDVTKDEIENKSTVDIQNLIKEKYETIKPGQSISGNEIPFPKEKPVRFVFWRDFTARLFKLPNTERVQKEEANEKDNIELQNKEAEDNSNPLTEKTKKYQNAYLNLIEEVGRDNIETIAAFAHQGSFGFMQEIFKDHKRTNLPFVLFETKLENKPLKEIHISSTDQEVRVDFTATYSVNDFNEAEKTYAYITMKRRVIFSKTTKQITSQLFASNYCKTLNEAASFNAP